MRTKALLVFVLFSILCSHMVWSAKLENRTMSDCWNAGIKCSNYSECKLDMDKNKYMCFCVAGFKGDLCDEDRNECDVGSAPCSNRGVCHNSIGSFRCDCLPGWMGDNCEEPDGSGLSTCKTGYTGFMCMDDFDECTQWKENPCEHGSTCANEPGSFTCRCSSGWEGRICNKDIDECSLTYGLCKGTFVTGNCTNIPGGYRCDCPYPYTGPACDTVSSTTPTTTSTTTSTTSTHTSSSPKQNYNPIGTRTTMASSSHPGASTKKGNVATPLTTTRITSNEPDKPSSPGRSNSSPSSNPSPGPASMLKGNNGDSTGDGGSKAGVIAGAIIGVLLVLGAVGAGVLVYYKYFRKPQKIGNAEETTVDKCEYESNADDTKKNTKWKPNQNIL